MDAAAIVSIAKKVSYILLYPLKPYVYLYAQYARDPAQILLRWSLQHG